ncbi:MAG TPA: glycoside hydrolase domain-containing protein, partial [Bacteroidota bacterium]
MSRRFSLKATLLVLSAIAAPLHAQTNDASYFPGPSFYGTGTWNADSLGNHRVIIRVGENADAVLAHIPWRRRDKEPERKGIYVVDAFSGRRITNLQCVHINREYGDIVFQPSTIPSEYYVYYLLYRSNGSNYPKGYYLPMEQTADSAWLKLHNLDDPEKVENVVHELPEATLVQFQAIDEFNSFYPMEIIATKAEVEHLLNVNRKADYLLFPEDRKDPIKMSDDLPAKWIMDGPRKLFGGFAHKGEFYTFQIGLFAARTQIEGVKVSMSDLRGRDGGTIPSLSFTSFNTGGVDWQGKEFEKSVTVERGKVQALWMGVQVPPDAEPGFYTGEITISPRGLKATKVKIHLDVSDKLLADAGDSDPFRLSRLRWLDSQLAADDSVVPPFIPMTVKDNVITCLGRTVTLSPSGF